MQNVAPVVSKVTESAMPIDIVPPQVYIYKPPPVIVAPAIQLPPPVVDVVVAQPEPIPEPVFYSRFRTYDEL